MQGQWLANGVVFAPARSDRQIQFQDEHDRPLQCEVGQSAGTCEVDWTTIQQSQADLRAVRPVAVKDYGRIRTEPRVIVNSKNSRYAQNALTRDPHYRGAKLLRSIGVAGRHVGVPSKSIILETINKTGHCPSQKTKSITQEMKSIIQHFVRIM